MQWFGLINLFIRVMKIGDFPLLILLSSGSINCTGSDMGHLFYTGLGNIGNGGGLQNAGPFYGVQTYTDYWLDPVDTRWAYHFYWPGGTHYLRENDDGTLFNIWVVRDGDSHPVPEPTTMLLLGLGLVGLAGIRKRMGM